MQQNSLPTGIHNRLLTSYHISIRRFSQLYIVTNTSYQPVTTNFPSYGGEAVVVWYSSKEHLSVAHSVAGPLGHKSCIVAALIARVVTCSDFRLASHVSHSRTECALQLASQHAVAADVSRSCKSCRCLFFLLLLLTARCQTMLDIDPEYVVTA